MSLALGELAPELAHEAELGLEIDVVRQFQMLDEAGGLHIVRMRQDEFLVLRGSFPLLAEFLCPECAIDQRHGHGFALGMAEDEAVAAREAGGLRRGALELVHHLAFGDGDLADGDGEAELLDEQLDLHFAHADLADERVVAAVAALRRVAERQQEALVATGEVLQAKVAIGREGKGIARQVADRLSVIHRAPLDQVLAGDDVRDAGRKAGLRRRRRGRRGVRRLCQFEIEQAMRIVERRPQHLTARQVLVGRGNAPRDPHPLRRERFSEAEPGQCRPVGADQEDRLDHVATGLLDSDGREVRVVERAFRHDAVDGAAELLADLRRRQLGHRFLAAALVRQQPMGVVDGALAALDRDVHQPASPRMRCCGEGRRSDRRPRE